MALFGQKTLTRTGMTSLGFLGLSSQSVSGLFGLFRPENPKTDRNDKPGLPRVVIPVGFGVIWPFPARKPQNGPGLPRVVIPVSGFFGTFRPENPETDWDDKLGLPRVVIPFCFGVFWPKRTNKNLKRTWMTTLGSPSLSSQSVSGCSGRKGQKTPKRTE